MFSHLKPVNIPPVFFRGYANLNLLTKYNVLYISGVSVEKHWKFWGWSCLGQTQPGKLLLSSIASAWLA